MSPAAEIRRCLIAADLSGLMMVWRQVAPHLADLPPIEAAAAMHMARVEARSMPPRLTAYSLAWLAERGIEREGRTWRRDLPKVQTGIIEAVGIASLSSDPELSRRIVRAMSDALLDGLERNIVAPAQQREIMLKARAKMRFKAAVA